MNRFLSFLNIFKKEDNVCIAIKGSLNPGTHIFSMDYTDSKGNYRTAISGRRNGGHYDSRRGYVAVKDQHRAIFTGSGNYAKTLRLHEQGEQWSTLTQLGRSINHDWYDAITCERIMFTDPSYMVDSLILRAILETMYNELPEMMVALRTDDLLDNDIAMIRMLITVIADKLPTMTKDEIDMVFMAMNDITCIDMQYEYTPVFIAETDTDFPMMVIKRYNGLTDTSEETKYAMVVEELTTDELLDDKYPVAAFLFTGIYAYSRLFVNPLVKSDADMSYLNEHDSGPVEDCESDVSENFVTESLIKKDFFLNQANKDGWYQVQLGAPFSVLLGTYVDGFFMNDVESMILALQDPTFTKKANRTGSLLGELNSGVVAAVEPLATQEEKINRYGEVDLDNATHVIKDVNLMRIHGKHELQDYATYIVVGKVKPLDTPKGTLLKQALEDSTCQVNFGLRAVLRNEMRENVLINNIVKVFTWDWIA